MSKYITETKFMQTQKLGRSDIHITPIITGTWQAGKSEWVGIDDTEIINAIRAGFDAGITTIDTAEEYGDGYSEQMVAKALSDVRDRVVYCTKVFANHLKYDQVIEACDRSLKNLNTDYIDLYQIHWPSGSWGSEIVPIEETMKALNHLKHEGKIRAIGVSNFNHIQLEEACYYGQIDSLQPPYSLFWRWVEREEMLFCVENNITILAYSSLAQGLLTGKFGPNHQFAPGDIRGKHKLFKPENYHRVQLALNQLRPIAEHHQTSLANLALAWLISQPKTSAIVGVRNPQQALENAQAPELKLTHNELREIDSIGRTVTDHLDNNPIMWDFEK